MQNPMGNVVVVDQGENLGFVDVTGVRAGMEYPVGINGKGESVSGQGFMVAAKTVAAQGCQWGETFYFPLFESVTERKKCGVVDASHGCDEKVFPVRMLAPLPADVFRRYATGSGV